VKRLLYLLAIAFVALPLASAQGAGPGQFSVACSYHHSLQDDPIVFPGQSGMSHFHDFAGAHATNAFATNSSLLAGGTTCSRPLDHSGYWVPTVYQNGTAVHAREFRAYYRGSGFKAGAVQPFPKGLRIIAGNAKVTDAGPYQQPSIASWACTINGGGAAGNEVEVDSVPSDCGGLPLRARLVFPQCWNGVDLDSADHKSHMAYAVRGKCPATHPVVVPQLTLSLRYWVPNTSGITLASGGTHSLHADFMIAWAGDEQEALVQRCINSGVNCGNEESTRGTSPVPASAPAAPAPAATPAPPRGRPVMVRSRALALLCALPQPR
jgi:hypothetical protein